jgi:hypothetical protein
MKVGILADILGEFLYRGPSRNRFFLLKFNGKLLPTQEKNLKQVVQLLKIFEHISSNFFLKTSLNNFGHHLNNISKQVNQLLNIFCF